MNFNKHRFLLQLIITFAAIVYLLNYINIRQNPRLTIIGDAQEYLRCAENTINQRIFYCGNLEEEINYDLFTRRTPFYPLILIVLLGLTRSITYISFFQTILIFVNAYLLIKILSMRNAGKYRINLIILLYLFYPAQLIYSNIIMTEIVLQFLLLSSFFLLLRFESERSNKLLLIYNLLIAMAVLTKPVLLYFWILNCVLQLIILGKKSKYLILYSFISLAVIGLWSYRNYRVTGVYHYSSIKNHNLLNYNVRYLLTKKTNSETAEKRIDEIRMRAKDKDDYRTSYHEIETEAMNIIKTHLVDYGIYHGQGVFNFFIDPGRFELYNYLGIDESVSFMKLYHENGYAGIYDYMKKMPPILVICLLAITVLNAFLLASFLFYIVKLRRADLCRVYALYIVGIIVYIAFLTGPIGASRFRVPIYPFLLMTIEGVRRKPKTEKISKMLLNP